MSEHTGLDDLEIVSDEHGNAVIMKSCKSAVRAQKKRERMESVRKRDEIWATRESAVEPIAWSDSEDCVVNAQKESGEQRIYDRAPSPLPNPFLIRELYLVCVRCPNGGLIEHPAQYDLAAKLGYGLIWKVSLAATVCRTCYNKHSQTETQEQLGEMMKRIRISPSHFQSSGLYKSMSSPVSLLMEGDGIAYIPIDSINNSLDNSCVLKSMINSPDGYIPSHLRGGFF
jgi:hypothetical protein